MQLRMYVGMCIECMIECNYECTCMYDCNVRMYVIDDIFTNVCYNVLMYNCM